MARTTLTHEQQIAKKCVERAKETMGAGWQHIGPEPQRGLVMSEIVGVIQGQCESIDPAKVLRYLDQLVIETDAILSK